MKKIFLAAVAIPLASGLLLAQASDPAVSSPTSWTGLLVSSDCQVNASTRAGSRTEGMSKSTPTNSKGQNTTYEQTQNQADRSSSDRKSALNATDTVVTPPVDSLDTRGSAPLDSDGLGADDRTTARTMDQTCRIGAKTSAFALRLPDGRLVRFDESSNAKIAQELQSGDRLKHKTKIFRAVVKGTLRDEKLHSDSIRM